ncbi:MAG: helix-turn-helix transcriptional regulator [Rouxiella badensis]|uniref:AraC family transcriptional regulator n=1 Tax=Rouxiella badensis TaxID=1646377 RepID=UPI003C58F54A
MSAFTPLEAKRFTHSAGTQVAEHRHPQGQLTFVTRGTSSITTRDGWWLAPPGRAIWVTPDVAHAASYSEFSDVIQLLISPQHCVSLPQECQTLQVSDLLRELALEALTFTAPGRNNDDIPAICQLIVHQLSAASAGIALFIPKGQDRRLRQITHLLQQDPGNNYSLEQVAERSGCSPRTLARLFLAETGMTFTRWRDRLRVVSAVDRLSRGQNITQVALELGYQSPNSFSTMFTRLLGEPPRRFMNRLMQAKNKESS